MTYVPGKRLLGTAFVWALTLSAAAAQGGAAAKERTQHITTDTPVEGVTWPAGSTLIYRNGFVRGCRSADNYCLSEVKLSRDVHVCGVPIPQAATVYVDYLLSDSRSNQETGVFLTVRGAGRFTLDGVTLKFLANVRCDVAQGHLRGGQLDEPHTFGQKTLPTGTWFDLYAPDKGGSLFEAWFKTATTFRSLALPKETMVRFATDGTVTSYHNYEYRQLVIQGVDCHIGFNSYAVVYPSGKLQQCAVGAAQRIGKLTVTGDTTFHESGAIATTTLSTKAVIDGTAVPAGQKIKLAADGKLLPL